MQKAAWWALMPLVMVVAAAAGAQSIKTDDNIETDGQLVSKVATGTAPLEVSSKTTVRNLGADLLDGKHGNAFALAIELLAAIESLDNPDPPCFDTTHRFVDCGNGTVTDTVTGVIWIENPGCFTTSSDWVTANETAALLFDGATVDSSGGDCGLEDGSRLGDWRLPTEAEWKEILDPDCSPGPKVVGNGIPQPGCFSDNAGANEWASGVALVSYQTSTSRDDYPEGQRRARLHDGFTDAGVKTESLRFWPVRNGQPQRRTTRVSCPSGQFVTGFDYAGDLTCAEPPAP